MQAPSKGALAQENQAVVLSLVVVALLVLWLVALFGAVTLGGLTHLLLVAAAVILIVRLVRSRQSSE